MRFSSRNTLPAARHLFARGWGSLFLLNHSTKIGKQNCTCELLCCSHLPPNEQVGQKERFTRDVCKKYTIQSIQKNGYPSRRQRCSTAGFQQFGQLEPQTCPNCRISKHMPGHWQTPIRILSRKSKAIFEPIFCHQKGARKMSYFYANERCPWPGMNLEILQFGQVGPPTCLEG